MFITFVGEVVAAWYDENSIIDWSQLLSNNGIDFLKMLSVYFSLIRKYILYGYQRDKSNKSAMCLMTHAVTHHGARCTQTVTKLKHTDIINNADNINTTSQTADWIDGNILVSNSTIGKYYNWNE